MFLVSDFALPNPIENEVTCMAGESSLEIWIRMLLTQIALARRSEANT